ncbi:YeiH family protein [Sporolactobacillus shoreicorticis]|uniref:YeiH family protein n=1 Tax=Sporolactobacillus shoreicorticis TaxID=1923877 RepID=A0ABW5RZU3_9BACL|nr:YeiH family protein [Sporolactobacillus shoreicorticis]MCO7126978.1 YeiH family protein [Sporolactobacillus shoreicorticis]
MNSIMAKIPGIVLAAILALPAWLAGLYLPIIGSPVLGILIGIILSFWKKPILFNAGVAFTGKKVLQYSIILMGFGLNLFNIIRAGGQTLLLMIFTLTAAFLTAYFAGKLLKTESRTTTLIGVGTAICGGSAIAATAPVIHAKDEEVAQSISTIFLFNVMAAFLFPFLGHLFGMSDHQFGLWAGTAINDTSSVVAAGYTFSHGAGNLAVIVKLTRTLMIIPVTLVLAFIFARNGKGQTATYQIVKIFPWFVIWFAIASVISTFLPLPQVLLHVLVNVGKYMIVMAMVCIGLNTNLVKLLKNGIRPILLGLICWFVLAAVSIFVQYWLL